MAHIHEHYDFTVSAFIVFENKLLLLHHKKLQTWLQPGGHVELDEDPEMALWREILEETGLKQKDLDLVQTAERPKSFRIKSIPLPFDINVHPFGDDLAHKHIDLAFLLKAKTNIIIHNEHESLDLRWFSAEEIHAMQASMLPDVYERCIFALTQLQA